MPCIFIVDKLASHAIILQMNDYIPMNGILANLIDNAGLKQAEVAGLVEMNPSRLSRLLGGLTELTVEEAMGIAEKIPTEEARRYAEYLAQDWKVTKKPSFSHVSLSALWKAEQSLHQVFELENDPDLKNAFVQQIRSCREALERAASYLRSTEHPVSLIGAPGVGKTTIICTLAKLRHWGNGDDLDKEMVLQTGGGRQTLCEVHVRNGGEFSILVEPCSAEEVKQYVVEFCEDLLVTLNPQPGATTEGAGLSAEADRAIRNMTGLIIKRPKGQDGKPTRDDLALNLAKEFPLRDDMVAQVLSRLELPRRNRTSISFPRGSTQTGQEWISDTFAEINYGRHADFSLPRRIEITVPHRLLESDSLDLRLIDTRGMDEPTAPRRDLQAYLDDPRAVIILCSGFKDAPEAAVQSLLERGIEGGLQKELVARGILLVLPNGGEDRALRDPATGRRVAGPTEGREIRREQIEPILQHCGFRQLPIDFADVRSQEDCEKLRLALINRVRDIRKHWETEVEFLVGTINRLRTNRKDAEKRAVFDTATNNLRKWLAAKADLPPTEEEVQSALIEEMDALRYASSLRASVNRKGSWPKFDYWHGLGFGTRREVVGRAMKQVEQLKVLIDAELRDTELSVAHDLIRHFSNELDNAISEYFKWSEFIGEGAFLEQLGEDVMYWERCQNRWGCGPGYKTDISRWTSSWFEQDPSRERAEFVEREVQRQWKDLMKKLEILLSSADGSPGGNDN